MEILQRSLALQGPMTDLRRRLHSCPEIGFDLPRTKAIIKDELTRLSLPFREIGKGALVGEVGPKTGKYVLLRADMDGLGIREKTDLTFRSENGNMHACGHDLHSSVLMGAVTLLKEREKDLSHPVRFLFQPAEELLSGARDAVTAGVCEDVFAAYMLHVMVGSGLPTGTVILPPAGITAPGADFFEVSLQGKGGHGADPSSGIDPLIPAVQICSALAHLLREFPPDARAALSVTGIQGGDSYNVIPDRVCLRGSLRCYDDAFRERLKERVSVVSTGIASAYGAQVSVDFPTGCPALKNDKSLREAAKLRLTEVLGDRLFVIDGSPGRAGSEDFSVISRAVPSLMIALSAGDSSYPLHHPKVRFDEECLPYGAAALATLAGME